MGLVSEAGLCGAPQSDPNCWHASVSGRPGHRSETTLGTWPTSAHDAVAITSFKQHDLSNRIAPRKREIMAGQTIEREPITKTKIMTDRVSRRDCRLTLITRSSFVCSRRARYIFLNEWVGFTASIARTHFGYIHYLYSKPHHGSCPTQRLTIITGRVIDTRFIAITRGPGRSRHTINRLRH